MVVCNFCLKHAEAAARANDVAICASCLLENCVGLLDDPSWWGVMLMRVLRDMPLKDAEPLVEPLAKAAIRFFNGHVGLLQKTGENLAARDATVFWRGAALVYAAIHPASMTALDARRAIYAALFAGDLVLAATITPARTAEKADRCLRCHHAVVGLLRALPGSPEARALRDQISGFGPATDEVERTILGLTEAFGHVRAGDAARGLAVYKPFRDDAGLRPWHLLAIGDALAETGDTAGSRVVWSSLADRTMWEPYWPSRARERLGSGAPYR